MYIPYCKISLKAKIWVYQCDRAFNLDEKKYVEEKLLELCNNWNSHGTALNSSFKIYDWFICIFVDESIKAASGCSIDTSVGVIKSIANHCKIDFFNRLNIAYLDGITTKVLPLSKFRKILTSEMIVYNNLVKNKEEYENSWKVSIKDTWLAKYLER